ncbi:MAG TPA: M24 family metallopeptidase [Alphaproteobacteria bacterium]|nr:M24 family metallopeptidase [Alphaproteobacteria bacterium]
MRDLLDAEYPQFGRPEMERRRHLLSAAATEAGLDHVLIREAGRAGSAVQWLTGWPVTHEAIVLLTPGERPALFVDHYNHLLMAERLAVDCDVLWGERNGLEVALAALRRRPRGRGRLGVIGAMSSGQHERLSDHASAIHDLNAAYTRLRLVKSAEEINWLRVGAHLTDLGLDSLVRRLRIGESEHRLADHVERGYVPHGGATLIHFFGITAMAEPDCCVPRQFTSNRAIRQGDVLFTEISGQFWFHPGQVLRTYFVGEDPPVLFRELSEVAAAAFDAVAGVLRPGARPEQVVEAASVIEDAGFSVWDDLVHGFGGGYLPPVIGSRSRPAGPLPDLTFEAGMTVVVQPNVVTRDGRAGVQTGEMVLITEDGCESLHHAPPGFVRIDPSE